MLRFSGRKALKEIVDTSVKSFRETESLRTMRKLLLEDIKKSSHVIQQVAINKTVAYTTIENRKAISQSQKSC